MGSASRTRILGTSAGEIAEAGQILAAGGLVAFPTETVYGLGANATSDTAVARIFAAKNRPSFNPLIAHVAEPADARALCRFSDDAERLASAFWPGALTLVLPMKADNGVSALVTAGGNLLAVRVPDSDIARGILRAAGVPVAAPSANPSGQISPTTAAHVLAQLDGRIDAVVDDGPCRVGIESTIVGFDGGPRLLRAGGIPTEAIEACLGRPLARARAGDTIVAPGQLESHYAPRASLRMNAAERHGDEILVGFGAVKGDLNLSESGDLVEAAANLFRVLHEADETGRPIAVAPIPDKGLGLAINDRLRRAAAPRPA